MQLHHFSLKAHPVSFVREKLQQLHILSTSDLSNAKDGDIVKVAGLVLVRQRPGTAKGVCFFSCRSLPSQTVSAHVSMQSYVSKPWDIGRS